MRKRTIEMGATILNLLPRLSPFSTHELVNMEKIRRIAALLMISNASEHFQCDGAIGE